MPFLAPGDLVATGLSDDGITITNPLVSEESVLRTSLLPGLLKAVRHNLRHRNRDVALFEVGHVFLRPDDAGAELPDERERVAVIIAGAEAGDAVSVWRSLCVGLSVPGADVANEAVPGLHPTRSGVVRVNGESVGTVGEVDPDVLATFDIGGRVAWLEIDSEALLAQPHGEPAYVKVSRFPSSDVDLAFAVPEGVSATTVAATVAAAGSVSGERLVSDVALFDVYRGSGIADGTRSLTYRVRFQADDRTLTDEEVGAARAAIIDAVTAEHSASLRG